ncbi:restriction endonuclease subunit S [Citricoccus nitrophenolicus]
MSDWQATTLGAVCKAGGGGIQTGPFGSQLHAADYVESGIPSVMPQNIGENVIIEDGIARITEEDAMRLSKYRLASGDIVYSRRGDVERRALVRPENSGWLCGTGCLKVSFGGSPTVDPRFISHLLGTEDSREWIVRHAVGATMLNLNTSILSNVPLRLPSIVEQRAIAEVLGALDDKIAANTNLAGTADDLLAANFDSATLGVRSIPLREVATVNDQSIKPRPGEFLRYIDISSVGVGTYDIPGLMSWDDAPSRARRHIASGDTVWATVRPNRRSHALILDDSSLLVASTGLAVIRPRDVGFAFLYEATNTPAFTSYLENVAQGSAYPAVNGKRFLDAPIPWPSTAARARFELLAASIRESVHRLNLEAFKLAEIRDTLLPQLMSGKLQVKDAESVLEGAI